MPKFSQESISRLSSCHLDLQTLFYEVVRNFDCTIIEGHRGQEAQDKAFADGKSKLKWPQGNHNSSPSLACDAAPFPMPEWKNIPDFIYFGGYVFGVANQLFQNGKMAHRIRYGGDFNMNYRISDGNFKDFIHFELIP